MGSTFCNGRVKAGESGELERFEVSGQRRQGKEVVGRGKAGVGLAKHMSASKLGNVAWASWNGLNGTREVIDPKRGQISDKTHVVPR